MDTASDYRILVAEDAVTRLERRVKSWGLSWPLNKKKALSDIEELRKALLKLKYSYLPAEMILESSELGVIVDKAKELAGELLPKPGYEPPRSPAAKLAVAEMRYALSILVGLPGRIRLGEENKPEYAVDVVGVEVTRVEDLTENLKATRASAGSFALTIVTNIREIKPGEVRAAAILPPVEFHGVISEAMYASGPIDGKYIGKKVPSRLLSGEVAAKVIELTRRLKR